MGMQDVDFELIYEPGKDDADPLDFLPRHPLPEKGKDAVERLIKCLESRACCRCRSDQGRNLQGYPTSETVRLDNYRPDWEHHRKDPYIAPFYSVQNELYAVFGLLFRMNQIIIPRNLQRQVIKAAQHLGHPFIHLGGERHNLIVGENVLLKQKKRNKWSTAYEPAFYTVIQTDGSSIAARRITDGREVYRYASQFKITKAFIQDNTSEERDDREGEPTTEDWREKILLNASPPSVQEEIITITEEVVETSSSKTKQNKLSELPAAVTRPRRDRRRPDYLKDYITQTSKLILSNILFCLEHWTLAHCFIVAFHLRKTSVSGKGRDILSRFQQFQ